MKSVRVGIIGSGYWGPNLIRNFIEMPNAEVISVADLSQERLSHIASRFPGVHTTKDYREFFTMGLDAVVIATPPATHYPIARECLLNGLSVMVEKPLTLNTAHAEELVAIADARNLTLMVGHTFEYNSAVHELKRLTETGELGNVYYIDAVRVNLGLYSPKNSAMWDLAPHDISIILYLLGHDVVSVSAQGASCVFPNIHDIVYLHLTYASGIVAHVRVSWLDPSKTRRITVVGSKKMVVYDDVEPLEKIKIYDKGVDRPPYTDTYSEFQLSYRTGDVIIPHINFVEPLRQECLHYIDCIVNQKVPRSNGLVGLNVVKILEAAEHSLRTGGLPQDVALASVEDRAGSLSAIAARQAA
jgi:predicted dehydrogenase